MERRKVLDAAFASGSWGWASSLGAGTATSFISTDGDGNVVVVGKFSGTIDLDPSAATASFTSNGDTDVFVAKYGASGSLVWARAFGGVGAEEGTAVAVDQKSGAIYVGGSFHDSVDFDPGATVVSRTSRGYYDAFVAKFDSAGTFAWVGTVGSTAGGTWTNTAALENTNNLDVDADGNLLVVGQINGNATVTFGGSSAALVSGGSQNSFILKVKPSGDLHWATQFYSTFLNAAWSVRSSPTGRIVISGFLHSTAPDFDPGPGVSTNQASGLADGYLAVLNSDGSYAWSQIIGTSREDSAGVVAVDSQGSIYVNGHFGGNGGGSIDLDPGPGVTSYSAHGTNEDVYLVKYSDSGVFQWGKSVGGTRIEQPRAMVCTPNGEVIMAGIFAETVDFDPGAGVKNLTSAGSYDGFLLTLATSDGSFRDATRFGGAAEENGNFGMALGRAGQAFLALNSGGLVDFSPSGGGVAVGVTNAWNGMLWRFQDLNVSPTNIAVSATSIVENAAASALVGTLSTSDPDAGDTFTYTLVAGTGDADNAAFDITGDQLRARASLDYETKSSYSVRVRSTDQGGLSTEKVFAIAVTNVNESPTGMAISTASIVENAAASALVGTLSTTDPDAGDTFTYALVTGTGDADNAAFDIAGDQLRARAGFDFETKSSYTVRVRSTDQGGLSTEKVFTIAVANVNESPTGIALSAASIVENAAASALVGTLSTTDPDAGDTFTYTLVAGTGDADNAAFDITGDQLRAKAGFDFETKSSYTVRVRSTDQGGLSSEKVFTIAVTDVNETPTGIAISAASIVENAGSNAPVGTLSTSDPDAGDTFTYALVTGTGDADNAAFDITGDQLRARASLDYETKSSYSVRVRSTDQGGLSTEKVFTIAVTNVNETPTGIAISAASIVENAGSNAPVGTLSTSDPDAGDTFTYTLVAGTGDADNAAFDITGEQLRARASLDYETKRSYSVRIRSTDKGGQSVELPVVITVIDGNDAPVLGGVGATLSYTENAVLLVAAAGTVTDFDSPRLPGGTLQVSAMSNGHADDRLRVRHVGTAAGQVGLTGLSVTYGGVVVGTVAGGDSGTSPLVVTFNASATPAIATAVLRNVTFAHLGDAPAAPLGRTLAYRMNDGAGGASAETLQTITILPVNDAPVLGGIAPTVSYVENDVIAPAASATVSDPDSVDVGGGRLTVSVAVNPQVTDRLQIANDGVGAGQVGVSGANVTFGGVVVGTFTGGTSGTTALVVTFNASATPAAAEAVLRAVRYRSVSENPLPSTRGLRYMLTDGDGGTSVAVNQTVEMTPINDAPVLGGIGAALSYTENAVQLVAATGTVTDVDTPTLPGGTLEVALTSNGHADDRLSIRHVGTGAGQVGLTGSSVTYGGVVVGTVAGGDSGSSPLVVTFNASATPAIATAVLRNVTFAHLGDAPVAPLGRTLAYRMNDGAGGASAETLQTITILPVNDAPVLGGIAPTVSYVENDVIAPAASATVSDPDSVDVGGGRLTVSVAVNPQSTDRLQIAHDGVGAGQVGVSGANVTFGGVVVGTFTGGTSGTAALVVTFNASATPAAAEAVLRAVRYRSVSEHPLPSTRGLRYMLTDGDGGTSVAVNQTVEMTPINDAPVLGGIGAALSYTENAVQLVAATGTVTDVDTPTLPGGTLEVALTTNGHADDRLRIRHVGTAAGQVGLTGSSVTYGGVVVGTASGGDSGSSPLVVTFNASATPAIATAVLRNVTFAHLGDAPVAPLGRTLAYRMNDGAGGASAEVVQTITIRPVNDAPVLGGIGAGDVVYSNVFGPALVAAAATVADVDSPTFSGGVLTVAISAGVLSTDRLSILSEGLGAGQIGLSGTKVTWGGVAIGTVGGGTGTAPLSVALNASATAAAVQALIRRIAYASIAADPSSGGSTPSRTLRFSLSDAAASAGGLTATAFQSLTVGP